MRGRGADTPRRRRPPVGIVASRGCRGGGPAVTGAAAIRTIVRTLAPAASTPLHSERAAADRMSAGADCWGRAAGTVPGARQVRLHLDEELGKPALRWSLLVWQPEGRRPIRRDRMGAATVGGSSRVTGTGCARLAPDHPASPKEGRECCRQSIPRHRTIVQEADRLLKRRSFLPRGS